MYKVDDKVRYKQPFRISEKGQIITKLKVIDSKDAGYVGMNVYLISYNKLCDNDLVLESQIIELVNE